VDTHFKKISKLDLAEINDRDQKQKRWKLGAVLNEQYIFLSGHECGYVLFNYPKNWAKIICG
jgi:hypothetical protein